MYVTQKKVGVEILIAYIFEYQSFTPSSHISLFKKLLYYSTRELMEFSDVFQLCLLRRKRK